MKEMMRHEKSSQDACVYDAAQVFQSGIFNHYISNTAYPINHGQTINAYRLSSYDEILATVKDSRASIDTLGLYVHIPFCEHCCAFCEYTVLRSGGAATIQKEVQSSYVDLLLKEFDLYTTALNTEKKTLIGFDIGGGTPSVLPASDVERIITKAKECFILPENVDISIETTPKIAAESPEKIAAYYVMGIRRISMGVQTINAKILALVDRVHTSIQRNKQAMQNFRNAGFQKCNIDVMYGLAGQQLEDIQATIDHIIELNPEYVTLYRTRFKGTKISHHAKEVSLDEVNKQSDLLHHALITAGYYGVPGKNTYSRIIDDPGTSHYLTQRVIYGTPYLGLGLGAQSYTIHTLSYNQGAASKQLAMYQKAIEDGCLPLQDMYNLSLPAAIGKFVSVSFYFGGINLAAFQKHFQKSLESYFANEISYVIEHGYMKYTQDCLVLTAKGTKVYNGVIALFYAPAVKKYLLDLCEKK
ncbi:MAG: radical SAM protein [candidate division SR1 bacterium]|nr:radical SAM protein [candidate division SR1 bacterium]